MTFGMFAATALSVIIMGVGTALVYLTLRESRKLTGESIKASRAAELGAKATLDAASAALEANQLSREAFIRDHRAVLSLVEIRPAYDFVSDSDGAGARLPLMFEFKNIGRSQAFGVSVGAELSMGPHIDFEKRYKALAAERIKMPLFFGHKIDLDTTQLIDLTLFIDQADIIAYAREMERNGWGPVDEASFFLVACVTYGIGFDEQRDQDWMFYVVNRRDAEGNVSRFKLTGETVPKREISIEPVRSSGKPINA